MTQYSLPLFPLNVVIFPEGLLPLRIFEARYLDMVKACLRNKTEFGVVAVYPEASTRLDDDTGQQQSLPFAKIGTSFAILDADVTTPGLMNIRCLGQKKFKVISASQQKDGLWIGEIEDIGHEASMVIPADLQTTTLHLQRLIDAIVEQEIAEQDIPISKPYKLDDCAWVANRWCEIINIPLIQKQRMLELDSPLIRLELVQDILTAEFTDKQQDKQ